MPSSGPQQVAALQDLRARPHDDETWTTFTRPHPPAAHDTVKPIELHTPRLKLRQASYADAWELWELWGDAEVNLQLFDDQPLDVDRAMKVLAAGAAWGDTGIWVLRSQRTSRVLGCVSLRSLAALAADAPDAPPLELVVALFPAVRGRGYACEAARAVIGRAIATQAPCALSASCRADNVRARVMLDRLGFRATLERRHGLHPQVDLLLWADDFVPMAEVMPLHPAEALVLW